MRTSIALLGPLLLLLSACVYQGDAGPAVLAPLSQDLRQPEVALLEHALTGYFAEAGAAAPTTCAALAPHPVTSEQEQALILRLVRLAPGPRCAEGESGLVDSITGQPALRVRLEGFACAHETLCRGTISRPGRPSARYTMRFEGGVWRFERDQRADVE